MSERLCIWNHQPPAEYSDLPIQPLAGWTVAKAFFDDVYGANTLGVNQQDISFIAMENRRDSFEAYYAVRMSDNSDMVDDLNTELSVVTIEVKINSMHNKSKEIDLEYFDALQDLHGFMDVIDPNLYDDYIEYLDGL